MIPVMIGGQLTERDESELVKREGGHENDNEIASWVEYWLDNELVHRSASVYLKKAIFSEGMAAAFG
jgi:hypothetical protein